MRSGHRLAPRWLRLHHGGRGVHRATAARLVTGDVANDLLPLALDPNVYIQESKAATCDIIPGRRPAGPALRELVRRYREDGDG